jgi:hypothetical protein
MGLEFFTGDTGEAPAAPVQAQPSGRAAADEDFGQPSGVNMVAGRTVTSTESTVPLIQHFFQQRLATPSFTRRTGTLT